jgi:threonine/homoserine/homoserine lactone efflux protein
LDKEAPAVNISAAETRSTFQHDLYYCLPRWMIVFIVIALVPQLILFPPAGRSIWYIPGLVLIGLLEGAFGALIFVASQRWWNPQESRAVRISNYVAALMIVGVGSLFVMTAIYR